MKANGTWNRDRERRRDFFLFVERFPRERRLTRLSPPPTAGQLRGGGCRRGRQGGWRDRRERLQRRRRGALAAAARGGAAARRRRAGRIGGAAGACGPVRRGPQRERRLRRSVDGRARAGASGASSPTASLRVGRGSGSRRSARSWAVASTRSPLRTSPCAPSSTG